MFTIEKVTIVNGKKHTFLYTDRELSDQGIDEILYALSDGFFRLTEGSSMEEWNEFVRAEWPGLDDGDYYSFAQPYLTDYNWAHYLGGSVLSLDDCEDSLMSRLAYIRSAKELLS